MEDLPVILEEIAMSTLVINTKHDTIPTSNDRKATDVIVSRFHELTQR
jgi:hypothetical protein